MTKLVIVHPGLYTSVNDALTGSFASNVIPIRYSDVLTKDAVLAVSKGAPVTHIAFLYHYPGYDKLPFFPDASDIDGRLVESTYRYFSNTIIDIIKSLRDSNNSSLVVDILSCNLNSQLFKEEVAKVEGDLGVDIRYSVDKTGNVSEGGNWVLESDGVNVRELYFTEGVLEWKGVLTTDISALIKAGGVYAPYITWNAGTNTYTVQQNFLWSALLTAGGLTDQDSYIRLLASETFDGASKTIDITGFNSWNGLISTGGYSVVTQNTIKNLGILNGTTGNGHGFFIRQSQRYFTVQNCYSTGSIFYSSGGIVSGASIYFSVDSCYSTGNIELNSGGITGNGIGNCTITNCYSTGNIAERGGGIVGAGAGINGSCAITNCYSTGSIAGFGGIAAGGGGIAAWQASSCTITNCYSTGSIGQGGGGITSNLTSSNCTITNCVSNAPIFYSGTPTVSGCSTTLSSIDGSIYGWSPSGWKTGAAVLTVSGYALPILKAFQIAPWIINSTASNYYTKATDSAKFATLLTQDLSTAIKAGELLPYISWSSGTYKLLQSFAWSILPLSNPNSYIGLGANEIFDGNSFTIDITGFNSWAGLFTTGGSSLLTGSVVKNLGILNGTTSYGSSVSIGSGFIIRQEQPYFKVINCFSTGTINTNGGGIAGSYAGISGQCTITNCYSTGNIGNDGGGITGDSAGESGICTIENCYSTGTIGQNAGGIAGSYTGDISGSCTIQNCYSTGATIGQDGGGIVGTRAGAQSGNCTIINCYSTSIVNPTGAGGIAGRTDGICTINNCVSNSPTSGDNTAQTTGCSTTITSIDSSIYGWSNTIWTTGGTVSGISLPILKAFQATPWISNASLTGYYLKATDAAQFAIVPYNLASDIKAGTYSTYITWNAATSTYTVQKSFAWSALNLPNVDSYIGLMPGEIFDGDSKTIDITGFNSWAGLFTSSGTLLQMGYTVKDLGILNGTTKVYAGFFIRGIQSESDVSYFTVQNCYSTGDINNAGGGIAGIGAGANGDCRITNCYSTGDAISENSGGIVGVAAGAAGKCTITSCYSTGTIGVNGGGIASVSAGIRGGQCNIVSCYNTTATISNNGGGIVGADAASQLGACEITDCYSIGIPTTTAGGIAGANAATGCIISYSVSSTRTQPTGGAAQITLCSTSLQDINGTLYTSWSTTIWRAGTDIDGDGKAYPLLLAFQKFPFISVDSNNNYYNESYKAAQFSTAAGAPTITSIQPGDSTLEVIFTAPTNDGGDAIFNYEYSTNNGTNWTLCNSPVTTSPITITGLTNGQTYQVIIRAVNAQGSGLQSNMRTGTPSPQTPNAPTITSVVPGVQQITINFTPPVGGSAPTNYDYSINNGANWTTRSPASTISPIIVTGLVNGQVYFVAIRSRAGTQVSISTPVQLITLPDVPSQPVITSIISGNSALNVYFTQSSNGGATITNYQYSTDNGTTWVTLNPADSTSPITISGLTNGTLYTIVIRAVNAVGFSVQSSIVQGTPSAADPYPPTNVSVIPGRNQITINFTPPATGVTPDNYDYNITQGTPDNAWVTVSPPDNTSPIIITGLANGQQCYVSLRSRYTINNVDYTSVASTPIINVTVNNVPSAPTITSVQPGNQTLAVNFTPGLNGGANIDYYQYSTDGGATFTIIGTTQSPIIISLLTNGQQYQVAIRAVNIIGVGITSNIVSGTPATNPGAPFITVITSGNRELTVNFIPGSDGGVPITSYQYTITNGTIWLNASWVSPSTGFIISNLNNGQLYSIQIRAINANNLIGDVSNTVTGTPVAPASVPSAPTNLVATPGNQQLTITFTPGSDGGSPVTRYEYAVNNPSGTWIPVGLATTFAVTGLTNGTLYTIYVRGVNSVGAGSSNSVQGTPVAPATVPSAPTILGITPSNQTLTVYLFPGDTGGSPITSYEYTTNGSSWTNFGLPPQQVYIISGLTNGQTYSVQIRAVNAQGAGAASTAVNGTPAPDLSTAIKSPTNPYAQYITWSAPNQTYTVLQNFAWTALGVQEGAYIGLLNNEIFDGNRKAIDLTGVSNWYGLFTTGGTSLATGSIIKNLGISNGSTTTGNGFIVRGSQRFFTVDTCNSNGSISASISGGIVGGNVGSNSGDCVITNSYSLGLISQNVGGIAGNGAGSNSGKCTIINCYSIRPIDQNSGGIVGAGAGFNSGNCIISSCYSFGTIGFNSGGIAGSAAGANSGTCTISNCYSLGNINGENAGGIVGLVSGNTQGGGTGTCRITNCYTIGLVAGLNAGSIFGYLSTGIATNCVARLPFSQGSTVSIPGCTNDFRFIDGQIYNWDPNIWAPGTVITGGIKLPILNGFQSLPWITDITNIAYYNIATEPAQFATVPGAPSITSITSGNTQLTVNFTPGANGGTAITSYEYSINNGTSWVTVGLTGSFTIPNLINGQQYTVLLRAVNGVGTGVSTQSTGTPAGAPYAPTITTITSSNAQLIVNFTPGLSSGSVITGYQYSTNNGVTFTNANTITSPITISGLTNGQTYQVVIRAVNALGTGASSNMVTGKPVTTPSAPIINRIIAGDGNLIVEFTEPATDGGSFITDYQYSINNGATFTSAGTDQSPIPIIGLTNGQTYPIIIAAVNAIGTGALSNTVNGTPVASPVPEPDVINVQPPVGGTAETIEGLLVATGQTARYEASEDVARVADQTHRNFYDNQIQATNQGAVLLVAPMFTDYRAYLSYKQGALRFRR